MYKNFKEKAFDIIQADDGNNIWSKVFDIFIISIIALLGIGLVAVPTGIISAGFIEVVNEEKNGEETIDHKHFCPYCGGRLD